MSTTTPQTTRLAPGEYEVTVNGRTYEITHRVYGPDEPYGPDDFWLVIEDDGSTSDPYRTKRDALAGLVST